MAANASLNILGYKSGLLSGFQQVGPLTINNISPVDADNTTVLSSGDNTINVPTNAVSAVIIPPSGNTVALILKGVDADTGIALSLTFPSVLSLAVAQTTFVLNAASGVTVVIQWI